MKFTMSTKVMALALKKLAKVVPSKSLQPVFTNVLLKAKTGGTLELAGSNSETSIVLEVGAEEVDAPCSVLVSCHVLLGIVQKCKSDTISLSVEEEKQVMTVSYGSGCMDLAYVDGSEFPDVLSSITPDVKLWTFSNDLKELLNQVLYAAAVDQTRPILTGVSLKCESGKLQAVTTDAHRVASAWMEVDGSVEDFSIVVPAHHCKPLLDLPDGVDVAISINDRMVEFAEEHSRIVVRALSGTYPSVSRVFEVKPVAEFKISTESLIDSLERSLLIDDTKPVVLEFDGDTVGIKRNGQMSVLQERLSGSTVKGEKSWRVQFDAKFLLDACKTIDAETIHLIYQGMNTPVLCVNMDTYKSIHVVLPVREVELAKTA